MRSVLKQQQSNILKERDILLQQLESKYVGYIHSLLQQKILISATITKQYNEIINKIDNSICDYINMVQNNNINPNMDLSLLKPNHSNLKKQKHNGANESKSNSVKTLLFFKQQQILKKKEISIQQLELKYSTNIQFLLHQKICISTTIIKQYDEMVSRIHDSIYNNINHKINNHINPLNPYISLPLLKPNIISQQIKNETDELIHSTSQNFHKNIKNTFKSNKRLHKIMTKVKSKNIKQIKQTHPSLNIYIPKVNLKCKQCDILFDTKKHFETHMKSKHNISTPYKCLYDNCFKHYKNRSTLFGHIGVKHIKQTKYECNVCHKLFYNKTDCKRHIIRHKETNHPELCIYIPKVNLHCNQCDKLFDTNKDFENHMTNIHSISSPYKCLYDKCDKQYSYKNHLIAHIRVDHMQKSQYECNICHKLFWHKTLLNNHMAIHKQDTAKQINPALYIYVPRVNLKCTQTQCDISFNTMTDFRNHMKSNHNIFAPYKCLYDKCDKHYKNKKDLLIHIRIKHIKQSKYECNVCHKLFPSKDKCQKHIAKCMGGTSNTIDPALYVYVPGVNLKCEQCDELFSTLKNFSNHMKITHNISTPYKCLYDKCDKYYMRRDYLIGHIGVEHIKKAKFECNICHKLFWNKTSWKNHIASHKNERPWKCTQCLWQFKTKSALSGHVKHVHNKEKKYKYEYEYNGYQKPFWNRGMDVHKEDTSFKSNHVSEMHNDKTKSNQSQITNNTINKNQMTPNMNMPMLEPNV